MIISCDSEKAIKTYGNEYANGKWYNGQDFERKTLYEVKGFFSDEVPDSIVKRIDLKDGFVIPPFGSAHNHNLDRKWQLGFLHKAYLKEGTFYYQNLTSMAKQANELRPFFERDTTLDVKFAQQGFTSTLGHPFMAFEPFTLGYFKDWDNHMDEILESRLEENNSYIFVDSLSQINEKLEIFYKSKPDLAKIYLLDIENFETNSKTGIAGYHGLSKKVARKLVEKFHEKGLTVYAHIETAGDFNFAIDIGVDCMAHMPGYAYTGNPEEHKKLYVNDTTILKAVEQGVKINPTVLVSLSRDGITDSVAKANFVSDFVNRYHKAGGVLLAGSDRFNSTLMPEIEALNKLGVLSSRELLNIICYETPRTVFPNRKIGALKSGFEASFLVLEGNPLDDIDNIKSINRYVKKGIQLSFSN